MSVPEFLPSIRCRERLTSANYRWQRRPDSDRCMFLVTLTCLSKVARVKLGNAEMTAEVQDVNGAQIARYCNERKALGCFRQHHCATHVHAIKHEPDIGCSVVHGPTSIGGRHHMLPAAKMIGGSNSFHFSFVGNARGSKTEQMDADTIELVDCLPRWRIRIGNHACCNAQHCSVQREAVFNHRLRAEIHQRWRDPVQRNRCGGWIGGACGFRLWADQWLRVVLSDR